MIVYDPFMGIGTTALACISLGVNYLGTEIDSEYVKVAVEDIEKRKNTGAIDDWLQKKENEIFLKSEKTSKIKDLLLQIYLQFVIGRRKGNLSLSI